VEGLIAVADDDGQRSVIRLVSPADGCAETVFQGDLVVRRVALEPAGRGVLFHGVGRSDRADLGTWRLVPGSGAAAVQILRPLSASDPIVRAIGRIWSTELRASHDGTQLAVQSCGASKCRTRVADLQTGAVRGLDDPEQSDLIGIDGTRAVTFNACTGLPCRLVATELDTGRQVVLAEAATSAATTMVDGRLVVAVTLAEHGAIGSMVIDAATGRSWPLATPAPGMTFLQFGGSATAGVEVPPGWVGAAGDARTGPLAIDPTQALSTPTTEESR